MDNKYAYSYNEYDYYGTFNSFEEACADAIKEGYKGDIFIGETTQNFQPYINPREIIESIQESAYDDSEYSDDYLENITPQQLDELDEEINFVISKWIKRHNFEPTWFLVKNIKKFSITQNN